MIRGTLPLVALALLLATGCGAGGPLATFTPTLTGVSPPSGPSSGGTVITLTGTNFPALSAVTVGGVPCLGVNVDPFGTSLTCTTPGGVAGTTNDVTISTLTGSDTLPDAFTYFAVSKPTLPRGPVVDVVLEDADGLPIAWWPDLLHAGTTAEGMWAVAALPSDDPGAFQLAEADGFLFVLDPDLGVLAWYADPQAFWQGAPPEGCVYDEGLYAARSLHAFAR